MRFSEKKKKETLKNYFGFMQKSKVKILENFIEESLDLLITCKNSISYTYALGYFLKCNEKKEFFEFLQHEVEQQLEILDKKV